MSITDGYGYGISKITKEKSLCTNYFCCSRKQQKKPLLFCLVMLFIMLFDNRVQKNKSFKTRCLGIILTNDVVIYVCIPIPSRPPCQGSVQTIGIEFTEVLPRSHISRFLNKRLTCNHQRYRICCQIEHIVSIYFCHQEQW